MSSRIPPLHSIHEDRGARFTTFGGWDMPVQFESIKTEHEAVRERVGIFDVSHMGQIRVGGPDAGELCQRLLTNDVSAVEPGEALYSMITDADGIILDDTVIYRLRSDPGEYLFVPNAGHDEEMYHRWIDHRDRWGLDASVSNETDEWAMFAVQGPDSPDHLDRAVSNGGKRPSDLGFFTLTETAVAGVDCLVSRTGYTGEVGFEIIAPAAHATRVWNAFNCQPCGLGARDTLRMEAGFLLSGQDFHPDEQPRNPYEARAAFTVDLDADFVGRDPLVEIAAEGPDELFVGIVVRERGIPRHGYPIVDAGSTIGTVTSGTMSPTFGEPIGLGYVPVEYSEPGTPVEVLIRDEAKKASIENPAFLEERR